ncbi:MAG: hypothetical protein ICV84_05515, partial [Flavisolibacter sp.]|nr:hypothetical protein [Flavisolibacter sp.]
KEKSNLLKEADIRFYTSVEEQDRDRLRQAINRSDTDKFYFLMNLMKTQQILKKGTIQYKG